MQFVRQLDMRPAEKFGELVYMLPSGYDGVEMAVNMPQRMIARLRHHLRDFDDNDYLVATGHPAAMVAAAMVAASFNNGRVKLLVWDKNQRQYHVAALDFSPAG